jgi:UDP-GlcNAc:undecaprenyl-phosphate GlcNAc-1-phosphate transferase
MDLLEIAVPLVAAFGVAFVATPLVGRLALAVGAVDRPNTRTVSQRANMPLLGGLAVGLAFALGLAVALLGFGAHGASFERIRGLLLGGAIMLVVGLWDDRFGMKAWPKFAFQILAAAVAISHGYEISRLTDPVTLDVVELPVWVGWGVSVLWIVGVTNSLNLLDGLDGLATGVAAIIGLDGLATGVAAIIGATLAVIALQSGQPFGVCIGVALVGALLGFLPHNFSPARIFLGDTGSLFVGFTLSLMALEGYRRISLLTFVVPLLALAVPILDTALSIVRRIRLRTPIFDADRLHLHHRLLDSEGSTRSAVLQFYFLTAAFCLIALSFTRLHGYVAAMFLVAVIALTVRLLWNLGALSIGPESQADGPSSAEEDRE